MGNGKKIAIMQPYFFPYIGYWQLMNIVDAYVIYDDVNYIKNGWINRNRILNRASNTPEWMTLELFKASPNKLINQIEIGDNKAKLLKKIMTNYGRAPFFQCIYPLLEKVFVYKEKSLSLFLENSIFAIAEYLGIETQKIIRSSLQSKNILLKGEAKVLDICTNLGGDIYINPIGGQHLYNHQHFSEKGIDLMFLSTENVEYSQFGAGFVENLSIIDVLMFNGVDDVKQMLQKYHLI